MSDTMSTDATDPMTLPGPDAIGTDAPWSDGAQPDGGTGTGQIADESEATLPGVEPVPGYIPISNNETANYVATESDEAADTQPIDADYADDPEFFAQIIKKIPKLIKRLPIDDVVRTIRRLPVDDVLRNLPLDHLAGTAAAAAGAAVGVPPPVSSAVAQFLVRAATRRESEGVHDGDAGTGTPSLLEVVLGADDRVRINNTSAVPWSGICQLNITARNGQRFVGTGWLIAPRCVITAGHCVYIRSAGGWASKVEVCPGRNGASRPFGTVASARFSALPRWVSHNDRNFDCGCIILPQAPRASSGQMPYRFGYAAKTDEAIRARALNLSGYPGDKGGITQWFHARMARAASPTVITYDIDTAGGQSGSPVWHLENNVRTAVGIHTNGSPLGNSATRITSAIKAQLDAWRSAGL